MSALFNRNVIVNQRKLDLLAWGDRLIGEVSQRREQIAEDLLTAEAALAQQPQAVTLLAKIENEQIVATWPA